MHPRQPYLRLPSWAAIVALALICLAGCKKEPFLKKVELTPYLGLPGNLEDLQSIDLSRLRTQDGILNLSGALEKEMKLKPAMDALRQKVEFDPWQDIDLLISGSRASGDPANPFKNTIFIARGRFADPASRLAKLLQWLSDEYLVNPPPFKESVHPGTDFKRFQTKGQSQYDLKRFFELNFAFPSNSLMLFSFSSAIIGESLDVMAGTTPGIQQDKFWLKMLSRPDVGAALWGAGNIGPGFLGREAKVIPAASALKTARQYFYNVSLNEDLRAEIGLVCESIEAATALSQTLKTGLEQTKAMLAVLLANAPETSKLIDGIKIVTESETSKLFLELSRDGRRALVGEWKALSEKGTPAAQPKPATPAAGK